MSMEPRSFPWWSMGSGYARPWQGMTRAWHHYVGARTARSSRQIVVFADPERTLLDHRAHPCVPWCPALRVLADHQVPLVLCSSRTRAELEVIQQEFRFRHPFISESGAAVYLPRGYFSHGLETGGRSGYDVIAFGGPHQRVVETLRYAAAAQAIDVRGFHDMSVQEVADECRLTLAEARLAQLREYDEPFRILSKDQAVHNRLFGALRRVGMRCVTSGEFHHVSLGADVRRSVQSLRSLYRHQFGRVLTVGVSTGHTDRLLREVDVPIVVRDPEIDVTSVLRTVPTARVTSQAGSAGWHEAILLAVQPEVSTTRRRRTGARSGSATHDLRGGRDA